MRYTITLEAIGPALVNTLKPVAFFDYGYAALRGGAALAGFKDSESAASIGAGLRWNWNRKLDASGDLAYVLNGTAGTVTVPGTGEGNVKLNFSLFYRF